MVCRVLRARTSHMQEVLAAVQQNGSLGEPEASKSPWAGHKAAEVETRVEADADPRGDAYSPQRSQSREAGGIRSADRCLSATLPAVCVAPLHAGSSP